MKHTLRTHAPFYCSVWWRLAAVLAGLGPVSGCETPPPRVRTARTPALAPPRPVPTARDSVPPTAAQRGYHRYRGTLGGRPVQLDLTVTATTAPYGYVVGGADLNVYFYYLDTGKALDIGPTHGFRTNQPLEMEAWADRRHEDRPPVLCTDQPVGPLLTGTYRLDRQLVPFRLQEDHSDCLRYEILSEETQGPPETWHEETRSASVSRDYLHLLGADTLRPARVPMQCPLPAQRKRERAALAHQLNSGTYIRAFMTVQLNEAHLLAYELEEREEWLGSRYYEARFRQVLYDLRTGRELRLLGQFRPGGRRRLEQLLTHQALADTANARNRDHWRDPGGPMTLPDRGMAVTPEGLVAYYAMHESDEQMYVYRQTIAWADVCPLLRLQSPLRRLLQKPSREGDQ